MKYSYTKHYKFKLEEPENLNTPICGYEFNTRYMQMCSNGSLLVKKGYTWDGSSIPHKKLWKVLSLGLYKPDKYCKLASLFHDALCQAMREGLLSKNHKITADGLYRFMCIENGMSEWRANIRYRAVRKFGDGGIKPEKNPRNRIYDTEKGE